MKKFLSATLIATMSLSLGACSWFSGEEAASGDVGVNVNVGANDKDSESVGVNVKVNEPVEDSEDVGINIKTK